MDLPTVLYKYTKRIYAAQMLIEGRVFVNTLHNLRKEDIHGLEIGDKKEGVFNTHIKDLELDLDNTETIPQAIKRTNAIGGSGKVKLQNIQISENSKDLYVFSLSTSLKLGKRFIEVAEYDTLVVINNPKAFIQLILNGLNKIDSTIIRSNSAHVKYMSRDQEHTSQIDISPVFIKEQQHAWQEEFRVVFTSESKIITPSIVKCGNLKPYIQIVKLDNLK